MAKKLESRRPAASLDDLSHFVDDASSRPAVMCGELDTDIKALFLQQAVPRGTPLMEYSGVYTTASALERSINEEGDGALNTTPCPFVWFNKHDFAIDARRRGNEARFVRRSCKPTAKILPYQAHGKHIFVITSTRELGKVGSVSLRCPSLWCPPTSDPRTPVFLPGVRGDHSL